ncbi:serine aminopeptidase domain-containing protein, partial [Nocardia cyriacigeorgica]|uniref:serine aminopeptidase domain-containing protein n=1 Tax=Nocardia cyriacigeorgica TaxID=135487 RepID=UPI002B4B3CAD
MSSADSTATTSEASGDANGDDAEPAAGIAVSDDTAASGAATALDSESTGAENPPESADAAGASSTASATDSAASTSGEQPHADSGSFIGHGARIEWRAWLPEQARAVVVLVHGVAEHSGRYDHVGKRLADSGFAVYAFDH